MTHRLNRLDGVLAVHRPEHGDYEEEVVELVRPMAPASNHGIRYEEEVHKGHQLVGSGGKKVGIWLAHVL